MTAQDTAQPHAAALGDGVYTLYADVAFGQVITLTVEGEERTVQIVKHGVTLLDIHIDEAAAIVMLALNTADALQLRAMPAAGGVQ